MSLNSSFSSSSLPFFSVHDLPKQKGGLLQAALQKLFDTEMLISDPETFTPTLLVGTLLLAAFGGDETLKKSLRGPETRPQFLTRPLASAFLKIMGGNNLSSAFRKDKKKTFISKIPGFEKSPLPGIPNQAFLNGSHIRTKIIPKKWLQFPQTELGIIIEEIVQFWPNRDDVESLDYPNFSGMLLENVHYIKSIVSSDVYQIHLCLDQIGDVSVTLDEEKGHFHVFPGEESDKFQLITHLKKVCIPSQKGYTALIFSREEIKISRKFRKVVSLKFMKIMHALNKFRKLEFDNQK